MSALSYDGPRLMRLVAAVRSAGHAVDEVDDESLDDDDGRGHEAIGNERKARNRLIAFLTAKGAKPPIAVLLDDGSIVTLTDSGDGLSVIRASDVIKMDG
jgi:hypothetical protein